METLIQNLLMLNSFRRKDMHTKERNLLELQFEEQYKVSLALAVYGTLAPGRQNHGVVSVISGEWESDLQVEGDLVQQGWAFDMGYPAMVWKPGEAKFIEVSLLRSVELPQHWERLDAFEGDAYCRVLVPVLKNGELATVANIYEAR